MRRLKKITALILTAVFFLSLGTEAAFAQTAKRVITGFEEPGPMPYFYVSKPSETTILEDLPDTINLYVDNSSETIAVPVTWKSLGEYEECDNYYYEFDPVWDQSQYVLEQGTEIPYAAIYTNAENMISTTSSSSSNEENAFQYLTENMGFNAAAACGILANLYSESALNPKNLQNSYEKVLGYTDSSYTKSVDAGSYSRKKFGTDSAGYGLCQWTYYSRKYDMYAYMKDRGKSIGDLKTQLSFMKTEMSSSQISKMKNFPNTSQGAYDAASYFCTSYERPANMNTQAQKRGKLARDTYWAKYKNYASNKVENVVRISGATKPDDMVEGASFTIAGNITSSVEKIEAVGVGVFNSAGHRVIGKTVSVKAKTYNLSKVDNDIVFGKLKSGSYTYKVTARIGSKSTTLVKKSFKITEPNVIKISGATQPGDTMTCGDYFTIKGKVSSSKEKLKSVTVAVYQPDGDWVIGKTVKPNSLTYNVYNVDEDIVFGELKPGSYVYKIVGKTSTTSKTLVRHKFKVKPKKGVLSSLKVVSGRKLKVTWKTDKNVTAYQIKYSTSKNYNGYKAVIINGTSSNTKTLSSLTKGKKYYITVRGFKKVDGVNYCGPWSTSKLSSAIK